MKRFFIMLVFVVGLTSPLQASTDSFSKVVDDTSRAVAYIISTASTVDPNTPYNKFLKEDQKTQIGQGTGFIISKEGYIVTNAHVIKNAVKVNVALLDYPFLFEDVEIIGIDERYDIAVLKVDLPEPPEEIVDWGDSGDMKVGNEVYAIGHGGGQIWSVTKGIVSALDRAKDSGNSLYIQTDTVINRGNSGGPLFNMQGEVIGVNTLIVSPTGTYIGYGFALPSNLAKWVVDELIKDGKVEYPVIGIQMVQITDKDEYFVVRDEYGLDTIVKVGALQPGYGAETSGILVGDMITEVNSMKVETTIDIIKALWGKNPGDTIEVKVWRDGEIKQFFIHLKSKNLQPK